MYATPSHYPDVRWDLPRGLFDPTDARPLPRMKPSRMHSDPIRARTDLHPIPWPAPPPRPDREREEEDKLRATREEPATPERPFLRTQSSDDSFSTPPSSIRVSPDTQPHAARHVFDLIADRYPPAPAPPSPPQLYPDDDSLSRLLNQPLSTTTLDSSIASVQQPTSSSSDEVIDVLQLFADADELPLPEPSQEIAMRPRATAPSRPETASCPPNVADLVKQNRTRFVNSKGKGHVSFLNKAGLRSLFSDGDSLPSSSPRNSATSPVAGLVSNIRAVSALLPSPSGRHGRASLDSENSPAPSTSSTPEPVARRGRRADRVTRNMRTGLGGKDAPPTPTANPLPPPVSLPRASTDSDLSDAYSPTSPSARVTRHASGVVVRNHPRRPEMVGLRRAETGKILSRAELHGDGPGDDSLSENPDPKSLAFFRLEDDVRSRVVAAAMASSAPRGDRTVRGIQDDVALSKSATPRGGDLVGGTLGLRRGRSGKLRRHSSASDTEGKVKRQGSLLERGRLMSGVFTPRGRAGGDEFGSSGLKNWLGGGLKRAAKVVVKRGGDMETSDVGGDLITGGTLDEAVCRLCFVCRQMLGCSVIVRDGGRRIKVEGAETKEGFLKICLVVREGVVAEDSGTAIGCAVSVRQSRSDGLRTSIARLWEFYVRLRDALQELEGGGSAVGSGIATAA